MKWVKCYGAQESEALHLLGTHGLFPPPAHICSIGCGGWGGNYRAFLEKCVPKQEISSLAAGTQRSFSAYIRTRGTRKSCFIPSHCCNHGFPITSATALQFICKHHYPHSKYARRQSLPMSAFPHPPSEIEDLSCVGAFTLLVNLALFGQLSHDVQTRNVNKINIWGSITQFLEFK